MQISSDSTSTYTNEAYSSSGFSGMVSGMDTESLVKEMLSGIQTKIDKQNQQKQQLEWKQEMYRDVITKINTFQSKYFDLTSSTSLRTNSFFNTMTTSSSSNAVKIISANNGASTNMSVQVAQLASAAKLQGTKVGNGYVQMSQSTELSTSLDIFFNKAEQNITFSSGDKSLSVNLWDSENLSADGSFDLTKAIDNINSQLSDAGMNISVTNNDGKLTVASSGDDAAEFTIKGSSNAMTTLGLKSMKVTEDNGFSYTSETEADASKLDKALPDNATINVTLDGVTKKITISRDTAQEDVMDSFTSQLSKSFGTSISVDSQTGKITAKAGQTLSISGDSKALGIESGSCTRMTTSTKLSAILGEETPSFSVNGKEFTIDGNTTISQLIEKVNSSDCGAKMVYNSLNDSFSLTSDNTGEGFDLDVSGNIADKLFGGAVFNAGKNAVVNIDGTTIERTSNTFTVNGVTMEAKSTTGNYTLSDDGSIETNSDGTFKSTDSSTETKADISAERDTSKITETLKGFVEDYNKLIEELNSLTHASKTYTKYAPLTSAQEKEMKESEITAWNKKAKEGLLSGDTDINKFLSTMRTALYSKTSSGFSLSNFGFDTSSDWKDYGKLEIDEDKLKTALTESPDDFVSAFKDIATSLNSACKSAANSSSASPGSLVSLAGIEGKVSENNNSIKTKLDGIADRIKQLQETYDNRKTRYWKQFSAMETSLSNMSSTSSYLTQMLGG